jgi:nucleoside-triphosphatase
LTGPPGIGKSTIVSRVIYLLRTQGYGIGGCLTKERRKGRERIGFTLFDIMSGRVADIASVNGSLGARVGKYRVNIQALAETGARALDEAAGNAQVIVIDEVGPMELTSAEFKKAADGCFTTGKPILAVVHDKMKDPLMERIRSLPEKVMIEVTLQNRDGLAESLARQITALLRSQTVPESSSSADPSSSSPSSTRPEEDGPR